MNGGSLMQYLKEEIRNRILIAALSEFSEEGYLGASLRRIASNADVALGTVYKYFKNKEDLFNSSVESVYNGLFTTLNKVMDTNTPTDKLIEIKNRILEIFKEHSLELLILFSKSKGTKFENFKDEIVDYLHNILQKEIFLRFENKEIVKDPFIIYVLSTNFIEGLYTILKSQIDGDRISTLIDQLLILSFNDMENRFKEISHIL